MSASKKSSWALAAAIVAALTGALAISAADPSTSAAASPASQTASLIARPISHAATTLEPAAHRATTSVSRAAVRTAPVQKVTSAKAPVATSRVATSPAAGSVVIHVITVTSAADAQSQMNRCAGPVEIDYSPWGLPNDIAQHNYCGGAWFASLATGTHVTIVGGAHPGTYVVGQKRYVSHGQDVSVLRGIGDLALQTCVGGDQMAYVGLNRE